MVPPAKIYPYEARELFSISFHHDSDGDWLVRCRELNVELCLHEPVEVVEAAELTGWLPQTAGRSTDSSRHMNEMAVEAKAVLGDAVGRDFPLPPVSTFADRLWEVWLAGRFYT